MPAVNWDQPSSGVVSDTQPALILRNDTDVALVAQSTGLTMSAESTVAEAVFAYSPKASGVVSATENGVQPAMVGAALPDPTLPNKSKGIGALGVTSRLDAVGERLYRSSPEDPRKITGTDEPGG